MSVKTSSCLTGQSLFELRFNASGLGFPIDAIVSSNATVQTLFAVTVPSNGTVIERYERHGQYVEDDGSLDVSLCLPTDGCYGLVDFTGVWLEDSYRLRWNGTDMTGSEQSSFPYFLQDFVEDADIYAGYESQMLFTEFGNGCSLSCDSDESLHEVQIWAGYTGASHSWRIEDADGQELVGCNDDGNAGCGTSYDVRVTRACLPAEAAACRRFVFGHPNLIAPEGSFTSDRNDGYALSSVPGAYNPRFVVSVDGSIVSDSTRVDGDPGVVDTVANFEAVEIGTRCPRCPAGNPTLLEVFAYRTQQSPPLSISLTDALDSASSLQNISLSPNSLQYARQCLSQAGCYKLQASIPESANRSHYERIPTVIKLDSVYFGNQVGLFDSSTSQYNYSFVVGAGCSKETTCDSNESLVSVRIDTSSQLTYVPSFFGQWILYDTLNPPDFVMPYDFTENFDRGYPAGSEFQSYVCVPEATQMSFGMFYSVPLAVTWSVKRNGRELTCRQTSEGNTDPSYLSEFITTNLDGSCGSALSAGAIAGIAIGSAVAAALLALVAWRYYRRGRAMASVDAQEGDVARGAAPDGRALPPGGEEGAASATSCDTDDLPTKSHASTEVDI